MNIGFIGLGAMGLPMARNIARSGHTLRILKHRRAEPVNELSSLGAVVCSSPAEIAAQSDAVITVLPSDRELSAVIEGKKGLIAGFSAGKAFIDMTTARPQTICSYSEAFEKKGVSLLDAPVSGGTTGAESGQLTIIVGSDELVLEKWRPLLECMGKTIFHVGGVGQGKAVKIVNQLLAAVHVLVLGEAFGLGVRLGANQQVLRSVISASSGYSKMMDLRLDQFLFDGQYEPGFTLDLMKKDVRLAVDAAHDAGLAAPLAAQAHELFQYASTAGYGNYDFSKAAAVLASQCGSTFGSTS